jgi:hypothetical protein
MSPVPLKKQSSAGTSMRKSRGEPSERVVEPMMVSVRGVGVESLGGVGSLLRSTEVMMTWGTL